MPALHHEHEYVEDQALPAHAPPKRAGSKLDGHEAEIRELIADGASISSISRRYKMDRSSVRHWLNSRGIERTGVEASRIVDIPAAHADPAIAPRAIPPRVPGRPSSPSRRVCWSRSSPISRRSRR